MNQNNSESLMDLFNEIDQLSLKNPRKAEEKIRKIDSSEFSLSQRLWFKSKLAYVLRIQGKEIEARELYQTSYKLATENNLAEFKGEALYGLAEITLNYDVDTSIQHAKNAVAIFQSIKNSDLEGKASKTLANGYYAFGDLDQALNWYNHSLTCFKDDKSQIYASSLANIALVHREKGQLEKAIQPFLISLEKIKCGTIWKRDLYCN
jgi:tetratricopeptide (TPR) repeat protein